MRNKSEQLIFKRKKIKEEVSLPHLYPPPPRGRGRRGENPSPTYILPLPKGGGGFGRNPTYILAAPKGRGRTKEGEGDNNTIKPLPNWLAITDYQL